MRSAERGFDDPPLYIVRCSHGSIATVRHSRRLAVYLNEDHAEECVELELFECCENKGHRIVKYNPESEITKSETK